MQDSPGAVFTAVLALLFAATGAGAQVAGTTQESEVFFETVSVNTINVDVVVTDRKGAVVTGLTSEDFEVFENGQPMEITNFHAVEDGQRIVRPPSISEPAQASEMQDMQPPGPQLAETSPRQPLFLIVFIDNVNLRAERRNSAFKDIRRFLYDHVEPQDKVMLASYERSLKIKQEFTSDPRLLNRGLLEMEGLSTNVTQLENERRELTRRIEEARSPGQIEGLLRNHSTSVQNDLLSALRVMRELVDSLAGLPGRKALLHVSDGMPMNPGQEFYIASQDVFPRHSFVLSSLSFDATRRYQELAQQANSNRVSFYTLDAGGVRVSSASDVERKGGGLEGFAIALDAATTSNLNSSLQYLADKTGGKAIINTNNFLPGLDELARDFRSYYSLGYTPAHSGDGRYHTIEVRVRGKGLEVRHREGYRDKPDHLRMSESTMSTLRWRIDNNEHGLELMFRPAGSPAEPGQKAVRLVVKIPLDSIVLVPRASIHLGQLKLYLAVRDAEGRVAAVKEVPVRIEIDSSEIEHALTQAYAYSIDLLMRSGHQRVAIGMLDEFGADQSFVSADIDTESL